MESERRVEDRIPVNNLPDCLKTITFHVGFFKECTAKTINASNYGMCFDSYGMDKKELHIGQELTLEIKEPYNYKLKSKVVYMETKFDYELKENKLRFGINFEKIYPIEKYHELLNEGK